MISSVIAVATFLFIVMGFVMPLASILTWMERRQSAYTQDRVGPSRAHFFTIGGKPFALFGLLHVAADGLKMFFKEPFIPDEADHTIFKIAPLFGFVTALVIVALIPFGPDLPLDELGGWLGMEWSAETLRLQVARIDTGILLVFAVASLGIYGTALAGWASNNRFALLGGIRAAAQQVSYEIALGLTVVGILIAYGTTELSAIVDAQAGMLLGFLPNWGIFVQPVGATLFFWAAIAETKRGPFDLPEGESEIIGYFVEYSSMGFGLFMLGEFIEIVVLAMLFTTLFLGGWQMPWLMGPETLSLGFFATDSPTLISLAGMAFFSLKVFLVAALQIQIRWTLPRFRYDQLMDLGWKNLLPLALVNIFGTALAVWYDPSLTLLAQLGLGIITIFILIAIAGPKRQPSVATAGH
jgi:NADH-quinone oxidoreductase subunit H